MELKGKTALITGSGVRIGRAIATVLAKEGCNLCLHYHGSEDAVNSLLAEVQELGIKAVTIKANLICYEETIGVIPKCLESFDKVDILINNAALYLNANGMKTTQHIWDDQFNLNLRAAFFLTQVFAQQIPQDGVGKVVNIVDAKVHRERPDHFVYRLTKAGMIDMTHIFALELAPRICVNAIALGVMMPLAGFEDANMGALAERRIPLKRIGSPEIAAENVLHLLRQDFMTGSVLTVDGGEYL